MQQSMDFGKRIFKRSQKLRRVQECLRVNMIALTSKALRLNMITTPQPSPPPRLRERERERERERTRYVVFCQQQSLSLSLPV